MVIPVSRDLPDPGRGRRERWTRRTGVPSLHLQEALSLPVEPELSRLSWGGADCPLTEGQRPHLWSQEQSLVFSPLQGLRQPSNWVLNGSPITSSARDTSVQVQPVL